MAIGVCLDKKGTTFIFPETAALHHTVISTFRSFFWGDQVNDRMDICISLNLFLDQLK